MNQKRVPSKFETLKSEMFKKVCSYLKDYELAEFAPLNKKFFKYAIKRSAIYLGDEGKPGPFLAQNFDGEIDDSVYRKGIVHWPLIKELQIGLSCTGLSPFNFDLADFPNLSTLTLEHNDDYNRVPLIKILNRQSPKVTQVNIHFNCNWRKIMNGLWIFYVLSKIKATNLKKICISGDLNDCDLFGKVGLNIYTEELEFRMTDLNTNTAFDHIHCRVVIFSECFNCYLGNIGNDETIYYFDCIDIQCNVRNF